MPMLNNIEIANLNFSYENNEKFALKNITAKFAPGKIYAILGPNGSGKSTLLSCINNYLDSYTGSIKLNCNSKLTDIRNMNNTVRAKNIAHVTQSNKQSSLSVYDTVMLGRRPYINISPNLKDHEIVKNTIDTFKINHLSLKATNELSGGEFQIVNIARAFAQTTPIVLLDEPMNNLDVRRQHEVFNIIKQSVRDKNLAIICVLHDLNHAIKYADELIFMKDGAIAHKGSKNIVDENLIRKIYEVDSHIFKDDNEKFIVI